MDLSKLRIQRAPILLLFALATFTGALQAATATLKLNVSTISLNCNSSTGPGASAQVQVSAVTAPTGTATIAVTLSTAPAGVTITPPGSNLIDKTNTPLTYTFVAKGNSSSCDAAFATATGTIFKFKAASVDDVPLTINTTLNPVSNLTVSPSSVVVTCTYVGPGSYTGLTSQLVNVTSAPTGAAFTVDSTTSPYANWLANITASGGGVTPGSFTVTPAAGCGNYGIGTSKTTSIHLVHATSTAMVDKVIPVTLKIVSGSTLLPNPSAISITYVKGSGSPGFKDVTVTSSAGSPFFSVDTTTLPMWLTADSMSATVPKSIRFSSTSVADALAPGSYSQVVHLKVSGQADATITVNLQLNEPPGRLTVSEGQTRNYGWTVASPVPSYYVTLQSNSSAIPYSITTGGPLFPSNYQSINPPLLSGLAYSFGTPIPVTFSPDVFAAAQAGQVLTGTVSISWGNPSATTVVTFNITVLSPGATLTSIFPASLPTGAPGSTQTLYLTGTGFITSSDPTVKTRVEVLSGSSYIVHPSISASVVNPSNIVVTITIPAVSDTLLPFANGGPVTLGVCNPNGATCSVGPGAFQQFSIGTLPTVQVVTSASAFGQVTPPTLQTVAPYDMLSIFGFNFCPSCSSAQVLYGSADANSLRYPVILSPDATKPAQGVKVGFYQHGTQSLIGWAPLLFATNGQINLLVPGGVSAYATADIIVNFIGTTTASSTPTQVTIATTNPGIFTVGSDGQGDGAILDSNYAVVGAGNPAAARQTAGHSDIIAIYMTGLGAPDSDGTGSGWEANCGDIASYKTALNGIASTNYTDVDGDVIQRSLLPSGKVYAPCFKAASAPLVTVGGKTAPVQYAGWVDDAIVGLYQVNVQLPSTDNSGNGLNILVPTQEPVLVTIGSKTSQQGVTVWVAPRLYVTPPTAISGKIGAPWATSNNKVVAGEGTGTITFAVTAGLLPSGLSLNSSDGSISGIPALYTTGVYPITVTATDSAATPVTGSVTFILTINSGLYVTSSAAGPFTLTAGSGTTPLTSLTPAGGTGNYKYQITSDDAPAFVKVDQSGNVSVTDPTETSTVTVTITVTDTTTQLTGAVKFDLTVNP